jgi:HEAT repeat protein
MGMMMAQMPANRTAQTIIADALAQLPAQNQETYNGFIKDLCSTGEEGVLTLVKMINPPGKGSNAKVDYALSGMSHYSTGEGQAAVRKTLESAYLKALDQTDERETKAFIIRQLRIVGTDNSVEALSRYLNQEDLCSPAAISLASIGTEKAGQALQNSLLRRMGTAKTQQSVILAIGESGLPVAEDLLLGMVGTGDDDLQKVVLYTLSRVGGASSLPALAAAAEKAGFTMEKTNANDAYIHLIDRLIAQGDVKTAEKAATDLLKKSTKAGKTGTRIAALKLLMAAQGDKATKTFSNALKDSNIEYRNAALEEISKSADKELYVSLIKSLRKAKPDVKVDILNWIGRQAQSPEKQALLSSLETGIETTAVQMIMQEANSSNVNVKQAASLALVRIGNPQAIPLIASFLSSGDPQVIGLAKNALSSFKGDISSAVAGAIPYASTQGKVAVSELLATRKASGHLVNVLELAKSNSPEVKAAAYNALKDVVGEKDLTNMCGMLELADKSEIAPLQQAVIAALSSQSPAQQVETLTRRMMQAGDRKKHLYYLPLASTGDTKALEMIVDGLKKGQGDAKDAAFEALLTWKGFEAAEELYAVCQDPSASAYFDRALTAYVRMVSVPALTAENRMIYLRKAMEVAKTNDQKNIILNQIGRTGTFNALMFAGEYLGQDALKERAATAVMNIALAHPEYTGENVIALLNKAAAALNNPDADYQRQSIRKHIAETPNIKGFVQIFNGKDLTGWKGLVENPIKRAQMKPADLTKAQEKADEIMRRDWKVEDGLLVFDGPGFENICTVKQYGDFEMYVDWKLASGRAPDAGIYLRGTPQVQMWDTARVRSGAQVGSGGLYNNKVYRSTPLTVADNKLEEWNTFYIKMVGDRVTVKLNGVLVVDNVILENFWDANLPIPAIEQIELQAHGSKVYYRNIYVKELERPEPFKLSAAEQKEGFKVLFDGTNMFEWTGNLVDYSIADGCIVLTPSEGSGGNLYSKNEYGNFVLRFEFQLTPAANNGLGIRAPLTGDAAYQGMELQILDNEDPVYANLEKYQYHGSVYGIIPAKRGFLKPLGEWNVQEVVADGDHIKVTLNGEVILDGNIREAVKNGAPDKREHPGLLNPKGHLGFLGHGSPVKFRNIRIKELK